MTRELSNRRNVNGHPHPDLSEAVAISRFWRLVKAAEQNQCWPWQGDVDRNGYGIFVFHGVRRPAHELALSFSTGERRAKTLDTCHSCDNPSCCNPNHLRFDTRTSNVRDMIIRGRQNVNRKLTDAQIHLIRVRRANGARQKDLARDFCIAPAYVSSIVHGLDRKSAGGPIEVGRHRQNGK